MLLLRIGNRRSCVALAVGPSASHRRSSSNPLVRRPSFAFESGDNPSTSWVGLILIGNSLISIFGRESPRLSPGISSTCSSSCNELALLRILNIRVVTKGGGMIGDTTEIWCGWADPWVPHIWPYTRRYGFSGGGPITRPIWIGWTI